MAQSRRSFLAGLAVGSQEWVRYQDPATEFDVRRLTSPEHESLLPAMPARSVDRAARNLLFSASSGDSWAPYSMALSNGQIKPLPVVEGYAPETLTFSFDDRSALLFGGSSLIQVALGSLHHVELAKVRPDWTRSGPLVTTDDGQSLFYVETQGSSSHIRRMRYPKGAPETAVEVSGAVQCLTPNPKRAMLLWLNDAGVLSVAGFDGAGQRRVETPPGRVLQAQWAPDGQALVYLLEPAESNQLNAIREQGLDSKADVLVAKTSQFAAFTRNANSSVFLGASRSKASPNILVLLRATKREFTLCEHKAKNAALTAPTFSANSQKVFFQSDRHGKMAIYMMGVEKLIEKTDS
ncbi:hypothetical protein [uncultured Paludibaculum sp.]|uniref:TolB family protein n=1 Tax=uncultured Paludibaculum sp. TaxID=1765020 RepID=UPI002AABC9D9|nr:hypothetical protein [uncultured Paludibaculum sp.]